MGKKGKHCESRRQGGTRSLVMKLLVILETKSLHFQNRVCCAVVQFYLTEFCDHLISWCLSHYQGGKTVITEFILENTMLFWNECILRVSTLTVGSSINANQVFVNSHSCFLVTPLWIKAFKEIWSKGWNIFFSPLWLISFVFSHLCKQSLMYKGWLK